jgi:hypothetical protein
VEGLKWIALALMTFDHIDKYLLSERVRPLFDCGRLAFPLFALVLAYNLARPGALERGAYSRILSRLAITAAVAEIPFTQLGGVAWGWYPLNILAALLIGSCMLWLIELGGGWRISLALLLFIVGGAFVEFWWPGVALVVSAWWYCRRASTAALVAWVLSTAALYPINGNWWALAAFPLIFYAPHARWNISRLRWAFYIYYPLHLSVLWGVKAMMGF